MTKRVRGQINMRVRELRTALKTDQALAYFERANSKEHLLRAQNPKRPVIIWTYRVVVSEAQSEAISRMSGWEILGTIHHLMDDQYALVARATDGSCYGVLYPTGELDRSEKKREFDLRVTGWDVARTRNAESKPTVIHGTPDKFKSGPVKANGMWESMQMSAVK